MTDPYCAVIANDAEFTVGVTEKVNEMPPLEVDNVPTLPTDVTEKSVDWPVVAPCALDTEILQLMATPTRAGLSAVQLSDDAVVGMP